MTRISHLTCLALTALTACIEALPPEPGATGSEIATLGSLSYSASNTNSAQQGTTNRTVALAAGDRITVATCGLTGSAFTGDTYLRLFGPDGVLVALNDDACASLGSSLTYTAAAAGNFEIHAGCWASTSCTGTVVFSVVPRGPALAVGSYHNCFLTSAGDVRCWGFNFDGQLGDGTTTDRLTPVQVRQSPGGPPLTGVQQLILGGQSSCALLVGGTLRCWGSNDSGELGDGTTTDRLTPAAVLQAPGGAPLTGVQQVSMGFRHTCALLTGGELRCWGNNNFGAVGDGTTTRRLTPVTVLTGVQSVALGNWHSCARLGDGTMRCWGTNSRGQLGDGTITDRLVPVPVLSSPGGALLTGVVDIAGVGNEHTCARLGSGELVCWGSNEKAQLGDGTTISRTTPAPVLKAPGGPSLTDLQDFGLGYRFGCARLTSGEVRCWGDNVSGELGDGTTTDRSSPVPVLQSAGGLPLLGAQAIGLGLGHACLQLSASDVRCWGNNSLAQLGDGTTISRPTQARVVLP